MWRPVQGGGWSAEVSPIDPSERRLDATMLLQDHPRLYVMLKTHLSGATWRPSRRFAFFLLFAVRALASLWMAVADCDEGGWLELIQCTTTGNPCTFSLGRIQKRRRSRHGNTPLSMLFAPGPTSRCMPGFPH